MFINKYLVLFVILLKGARVLGHELTREPLCQYCFYPSHTYSGGRFLYKGFGKVSREKGGDGDILDSSIVFWILSFFNDLFLEANHSR